MWTRLEEIGGLGMLEYIKTISKKERKKWKRFYEIDVAFARTLEGHYFPKTFCFGDYDDFFLSEFLDEHVLPRIGKGICPIDQNFASYSDPKYNVNAKQVRKYLGNDFDIKYIAVPVVDMHYEKSICNFNDVLRMYEWLKDDIEKLMNN